MRAHVPSSSAGLRGLETDADLLGLGDMPKNNDSNTLQLQHYLFTYTMLLFYILSFVVGETMFHAFQKAYMGFEVSMTKKTAPWSFSSTILQHIMLTAVCSTVVRHTRCCFGEELAASKQQYAANKRHRVLSSRTNHNFDQGSRALQQQV